MNIHLRTALDYIRRSPFQALAAIFVLSLTFFVSTFLAVLLYSSGQIIKYFETRPQIIAFIKDDAQPTAISDLQKKLGQDPRIKQIKFVTKEEALTIYKKATSDNPLLGELVSPSIFPASLEFSVHDLSNANSVIEEVKKESIVESVGFTAAVSGEKSLGDVVNRLRTITWYLRIGGGAFVGVLLGTSFLVLLVIIGMRMTARREEIEILKLIGATGGFIRSPIILESLIYAFIGVFLGWVTTLISILYLTPAIFSYFGDIPVLPRNSLDLFILFGIMLGVEVITGFLLALFGSLLAVSRVRTRR